MLNPQISEIEPRLLETSSELAKAQLKRAVALVSEVTGREQNDVDVYLVGAVVQTMATNYLTLSIAARERQPSS